MRQAVYFGPKILVGVDGSANSAAAMAWAIAEARAREASVEAIYVWQVPSLAYSAPGYIPLGDAEVEKFGQQLLEKALAGIRVEDVKVTLRTVEGAPSGVLLREAQEPDSAMVVVGARGHSGVVGLLLGSVSHALTHHCPTALAIVPPGWDPTDPEIAGRRILVGVDGSRHSERALAWAIADSSSKKVPVEAVTVWSPHSTGLPARFSTHAVVGAAPDDKIWSALLDTVRKVDDHRVGVECMVLQGDPARALVDRATSAQLLVVGTRGLGWAHEAMTGSVSHACTHHATVPVVVIPDETGRENTRDGDLGQPRSHQP